jgi:hypothetical protein
MVGATKKPARMGPDEKRLVREMHFDRHMRPTDIAKAVGRDLSSICRLLAQKKAPNPSGGRAALSTQQIDRAAKVLEEMIDKADGCAEITVPMLKKRCRFACCDRVLLDALHKRGYWFRTLRKKMILTPDDIKTRFKWSKHSGPQGLAVRTRTVNLFFRFEPPRRSGLVCCENDSPGNLLRGKTDHRSGGD